MDGVVMNAKELEVYFEAAPEQGAGEKEKKGGDVRAKAPDSKQEKGAADGLRQVVATGEVAIVQERKRADGVLERSVAKAHRAVYEASSGNVTLTGWPQVKNGENVVSALSEDTVIVMNEKGVLDVQGKAKGAFVRDASGLKKSEKAGATGGRAQ
jgi:lipopolysaccharide export system protein LptA